MAATWSEVTQQNRLIAVQTPVGEDVLLLDSFALSEGMSRPFHFDLRLLADTYTGKDSVVAPDKLIGGGMAISVTLPDRSERFFHGIVRRFSECGRDERFIHYRAELVPWLSLLTLTSDCRIFQNRTVIEIITQIFDDLGFSDYRFACTGSYVKREYCVQYRETDFNFVTRLMEEEGIFYFFEQPVQHQSDVAGYKHILVMGDAASAPKDLPDQSQFRFDAGVGIGEREDTVMTWEESQELRSGKWSLRDYYFETPTTSLAADAQSVAPQKASASLSHYDYPGLFRVRGEGDSLVRVRMEEEEVNRTVINGTSCCRAFTSGYKFKVSGIHGSHAAAGPFLLTSVEHSAVQAPPYAAEQEIISPYTNIFTAIPATVTCRPIRYTPKPVVQGPQTAVVVGPAGEEIYCDKYGRVKVHFHWDREHIAGDGKPAENSSCWIRVAQIWAGKNWGAMAIPRVGQEVIVDFLEGDPDRPIVTGRVYNAVQMPPYQLPGEQTKTTIKSNSSKGGQGFNEIRLEDKKGSEQVFIHGEKDMDIRVKNDRREWIGNDRHLIVKRDKLEHVDRDRHTIIKRDDVESVERDHHLKVQGKEAIEIGGSLSLAVKGAVAEEFKQDHSEQTTGSYYVKARQVVIEASTGLTISVGGNFITINSAGVQISGTMVMINSGGSALPGSAGSLVSPLAPQEAAEADKAEPGAKSDTGAAATAEPKASPKSATQPAAAARNAPTHNPAAAENQAKKSWIEIELKDEAGKPVAGEYYRVTLPDGSTVADGTLDEKGFARVDHIDPGTCKVTFPNLDQEAWRKR